MAHEHDHPGLDLHVERTGPCLASVRVRVSAEEFQKSRALGFRNVARRTRIKGFRPGKAPAALLERQFGEEIDREVVQHFFQHAYDTAVRENDLRPAAQPRIDLGPTAPAAGESWEQEFEILLRPDIELGQVEGLEIEGQPIEVSGEEIDAALEDLRRQLSRPEPAGDEGLPADGMAVCRLEFLRPEHEQAVLDREGIRLTPRTPPPGLEAEAFESALTGARVGDVRQIDIVFPDDFPDEEARGEKGTCRVTVSEAFRIIPPTDEELRERLDVPLQEGDDAEAGLRAFVRARIESSKHEAENRRIENALLDRLLAEHPMELPEPLVASQVDARVAELRQALEAQNLDPAQIKERLAEEGRQASEATSRAMRTIYLMEEIARAKDLRIGEKDLEDELRTIAQRNGAELAEVRKYYQDEGLFQQLALELLERNVRSFLRESADIKLP